MASRIFSSIDLNTDDKDIIRAYNEFAEYHNETQAWRLERVDNQRFYFAQNKDHLFGAEETKDPSTVLFSSTESLVADFNDAFPEPTIIPQEKNDSVFAEELKSIVRHILDRRDYEQTYIAKNRRLCIDGTAVQEVFWDSDLYNGLGDVNIRKIDVINFYWDTHTDDIQDGRSCIKIAFHTKDWFNKQFGNGDGKDVFQNMHPSGKDPVAEVIHEYVKQIGLQNYDPARDIMLMEYWFKDGDAVRCLKIAGGCMLYDSRKEGLDSVYDDGLYPFVFEPMYQIEGHAHGYGIIDMFKRRAITLDRLNQYILKFAEHASKSRMFYDKGMKIDWDAYHDETKELIAAEGLQAKMLEPVPNPQLPQWVRDWYMIQTDELKTEIGQNEFSRGEAGKGITAATAISQLQEAGSKRSRLMTTQLYSGFKRLVNMVISRMVQFYTEDRTFYILGLNPKEITINSAMFSENGEITVEITKPDGVVERVKEKRKRPFAWDVNVEAQRKPPHMRQQKNDLAIQLMQMSQGQFTAEAAIAMMDFEGKDEVLAAMRKENAKDQLIAEMQAQLEQMAQLLEATQAGVGVQQAADAELGALGQSAPTALPEQQAIPAQGMAPALA